MQFDKAEASISEAMKLDTKNPELFYWKGYIALQKKNYQQSIGFFAAALKLKNNYHEAYFSVAQAYTASEDLNEALNMYDKAVLYCPTCKEYYLERGKVKYALNKNEAAFADFNQAIILDSNDYSAYNCRGLSRVNILQPNNAGYTDLYNAYLDFSKSIKLSSDFQPALKNRGIVSYHLGKYSDAFKDLKKATQLNPKDNKAFEILGLVLFEQKQFTLSIEAFSNAIDLSAHSDANLYIGRAEAFMKIKDMANARFDLEDALLIDANKKGLIYWMLARTYAVDMNHSKMMDYLRKAQKAGYFDSKNKVNELRNLDEFSPYQTDKDYFDFLRKVADMN